MSEKYVDLTRPSRIVKQAVLWQILAIVWFWLW